MAAQSEQSGNTCVSAALGLFDGVHLGHRSVLASAAARGFCHAVTFAAETVPQKHGQPLSYLYGTAQKEYLLCSCGAGSVMMLDFQKVSHMDGYTFCKEILCDTLHMQTAVCGEDYRFGHHAAYGVEELRRFGAELGFAVVTVPQCCDTNGQPISSSRIRLLLEQGEIAAANALLGEEYTLYTEVIHGNAIGRTLGFPTANQPFDALQCIPKRGVYASLTEIDGVWLPSVTNIGLRPTIAEAEKQPLAETHILQWSGELAGKMLKVRLCRYVRPERKFASAEDLAAQIQSDILACRTFVE